MTRLSSISITLGLVAFAACGDSASSPPDAAAAPDATIPTADAAPAAVTIPFTARLGSSAFSCGAAVDGIGSPAHTVTATDLRFYVYDVALIASDGTSVPIALDDDAFQHAGIALLDFENGCGTDGTPALHTSVTGTVAGTGFTGLSFTLGVPPDKDFVDLAAAAPPLDVTGMYWIWQYGYKFFKLDATVDVGTSTPAPYFLHLGSSGCPGSDATAPPTAPCAFPNRVTYTLDGFHVGQSTVVVDVGAVLANSDLSVNTADTAPGCMSEPADPECALVLPRMGVNTAAPQVLFSVQ